MSASTTQSRFVSEVALRLTCKGAGFGFPLGLPAYRIVDIPEGLTFSVAWRRHATTLGRSLRLLPRAPSLRGARSGDLGRGARLGGHGLHVRGRARPAHRGRRILRSLSSRSAVCGELVGYRELLLQKMQGWEMAKLANDIRIREDSGECL